MSKLMLLALAVAAILMGNLTLAEYKERFPVFAASGVVPDVVPQRPPTLLQVTYGDDLKVENGNELTPTQVQNQPTIKWDADDDAFYTLIMSDPDAPSLANPINREYKHWLVVNIPGNNLDQGEVLADYIGAGPPKNTNKHRYVFLLYKQPGKLEFHETRVPNTSSRSRPKFKATNFAEKYDLGSPIAGNFFRASWDAYVPILHKQMSGH